MPKSSEYRIKKLEKGPLQRFKNQNLLIKKYGEIGLQIYKAITGKRTTSELRKDLGVDQALFDQVVNYMVDAGMIELEPTSGEGAKPPREDAAEAPPEELEEEKPSRKLEEIPPEEELEPEKEEKPLEEPWESKKKEPKRKPAEEEISFEEIKPIAFGEDEPEPQKEEKPSKAGKKKKADEFEFEEIKPVSDEEAAEPEEETPPEPPPEPEPEPEAPEEPSEDEKPIEEMEISAIDEEEKGSDEPELSPVEKIISGKYGDIGLRVYALIDGQRTAEEIMRETGLTEPKLVEILDFMDEQGIIKLDYPKGGTAAPAAGAATYPSYSGGQAYGGGPSGAPPAGAKREEMGFTPMIEGEDSLDEARAVPSPVEMPIKAPLDMIKGVQMKAKLMLKFKENKGGKVFDQIDGKNDIIDIALKLDMPLYEVADILRFMMENGMVLMKPLTRTDVRKKYGDDGYSVYKKFGKEALMLYELIGKEMTIKQMADKITTDRVKVIDMFIFIHKVLGIELPIDKDVLSKQLGL